MTDRELKTLKDNLWHAADVLRSGAHLAANKYGQPILGLIFLRYADILFKQHKDEIDAEYTKRLGTRMCNIQPGEEIEYCNNPEIKCTVVDDKTVSYQGQSYSLSSLAQLLTGSKYSVAGPRYFKYKGEWLNDIRHRLEG